MSDTELPPPAEGAEPRAYEPKPPLWKPNEKAAGMSRLEMGLTVGLLVVVVAMAGVYFEPQYFATPATAVPVQILSVSSAIPRRSTMPPGSPIRSAFPTARRPASPPIGRTRRGRG